MKIFNSSNLNPPCAGQSLVLDDVENARKISDSRRALRDSLSATAELTIAERKTATVLPTIGARDILPFSLVQPQVDWNLESFGSHPKARIESLREYGNFTMAFSTLQPGMEYFESCGGYLAFNRRLGVTLVLGDPVGHPENHATILREFLAAHRNCCFCQISPEVGSILSGLGLFVNEIGADMQLDLPTYDFEGPKKAKLRQAARKIVREGYRIEELDDSQVNQRLVNKLNSSWLTTKSVQREARFLVRPFRFGVEPWVRKFYLLDENGELVSFIIFDPIFEAGRVIGYSPSIKRRSPNSPVGAEEAVTKYAIEQFQAEGKKSLRLGLLPLYEIGISEFGDAWPLRKVLQWLYRHGDRWIYSFRGHADFKHRYRGTLIKSYLATDRSWGNTQYMIALMRNCNIF